MDAFPFFGEISGWPEVQLKLLGRSHAAVPPLELLLELEDDELLELDEDELLLEDDELLLDDDELLLEDEALVVGA